jgi:plasmid maintenance system antidote protein VapI
MRHAVRETLEFQGRSQRWLAELLGVHESTLGKALDGERRMPADWPDRIARYLDIPRDLLFFELSSSELEKSTSTREQVSL